MPLPSPPLPPSPAVLPKLQSRGRSRNFFARGGGGIILILWAWVTNSGEGCGVKPEPLYTVTLRSISTTYISCEYLVLTLAGGGGVYY